MTTVAFDGKMVAADSLMSGDYNDYVKKIVRIGSHYICTAGDYESALLFIRWYKDKTKPKPEIDDDFCALDVSKNKVFYYGNLFEPIPVSIPCSIGSGSNFAMGAMAAGASAKEAVRIAIKYDNKSGGKILCYDVA